MRSKRKTAVRKSSNVKSKSKSNKVSYSSKSVHIDLNIRIPNYAKKDSHHWADYIELLCLVNKDGEISQADFLDRISPQRDLEDSEGYDGTRSNYEINATQSLRAEDYFTLLAYRASTFKDYYPFILSSNKKMISIKPSLKLKNKIYLSLLFSSQLGYFNKFQAQLTSSFEHISNYAIKRLLPENSKSVLFGSSNIGSKDANKTAKPTLFWNKLNQLASDLRENIKIKKEELSSHHLGDGGLDIYAWVELGDNNRHVPLIFCQCACTPDWDQKQNSSKFNRWDNFIGLSTYPLNVIFIPFSFRKATGDWHEFYKIEKSILIDRERLIFCFKDQEINFNKLESIKVIEQVLTFKESIV